MTTMGGCSGGVTALLYGLCPEKFGGVGYPSLEYSINGVLSGMVAVCGCCAVVPIWSVFWFISPIAVASFFINMKINEKLNERGKCLNTVEQEEFRDIAQSVGLKEQPPPSNN